MTTDQITRLMDSPAFQAKYLAIIKVQGITAAAEQLASRIGVEDHEARNILDYVVTQGSGSETPVVW